MLPGPCDYDYEMKKNANSYHSSFNALTKRTSQAILNNNPSVGQYNIDPMAMGNVETD